MDKSYLIKLITENKSIRQIGKETDHGYSTVRYWLRKYGLKTTSKYGGNPKSRKIRLCVNCGKELTENQNRNKHCSLNCHIEYTYKIYISRWKDGLESGHTKYFKVTGYIRKYLFKKYNNKCCKCGWGEINQYSKTIPLEVDHIDGNWQNNKEENLELICPSCHSLTSTYRGLNKGNGRNITWVFNLDGKSA